MIACCLIFLLLNFYGLKFFSHMDINFCDLMSSEGILGANNQYSRKFFVLLALLWVVACEGSGSTIVLRTEEDFNKTISKHKQVVVYFYTEG